MKTLLAAVVILLGSSTLLSAQSVSLRIKTRDACSRRVLRQRPARAKASSTGRSTQRMQALSRCLRGRKRLRSVTTTRCWFAKTDKFRTAGRYCRGATVEVIGPMIKKGGNSYVITASKVFSYPAQRQLPQTPPDRAPGDEPLGSNSIKRAAASTRQTRRATTRLRAIRCNSGSWAVAPLRLAPRERGAGARRTTVTPASPAVAGAWMRRPWRVCGGRHYGQAPSRRYAFLAGDGVVVMLTQRGRQRRHI